MNVYITLDYELVLGRKTGTVENCIIKPTEHLCKMLAKYNVKVTFFVDCAYLLRINQLKSIHLDLENDWLKLVDNIKYLSNQGHSIQYHFHPQWLFSDYRNNSWILDFKHYKLSDVPEDLLKKSFKEGIEILRSIVHKPVVAFRAGGYSLTSYDNYIKLFLDNGITIDSSNNGDKKISKLHVYDYTNSPKKAIYMFQNSVLEEDAHGIFKEFKISISKSYSSINYLRIKNKLEKKYFPSIIYCDGGDTSFSKLERVKELFFKLFKTFHFQACIDGIMSQNLIWMYDEIVGSNEDNMVIIGHPKGASDFSIDEVEKFIIHVLNNGDTFNIIL